MKRPTGDKVRGMWLVVRMNPAELRRFDKLKDRLGYKTRSDLLRALIRAKEKSDLK